MIAKNQRAQLHGQVCMRLSEARLRRETLQIHSPEWWYWKGKVKAYKSIEKLIFQAWKKLSNAAGK